MNTAHSKESKSTILIAGCGYVGRRAASLWVNAGHKVYAVTRTEKKAEELSAVGIEPVLLDLSHPASGTELPAATTILWAVGFDRSAGTPREQIWLDGLNWFIAHLTGTPERFIYVSSTSVYGSGDGGEVNEQSAVQPVTEGGRCCVTAEQLMRNECEKRFPGIATHVLRFAGIYGPDRLLRRVEQLRSGEPLPGNPDNPLNLIHVDDAVRVIEYARTALHCPELINVVNTGTLSRREYYNHLASLVDAPPAKFDVAPAKQSRGGNRLVVSNHRAATSQLFQFDDVRQGIEDAVHRSQL